MKSYVALFGWNQPEPQLLMVPVAAPDDTQAIQVAAQQCTNQGMAQATFLALLDREAHAQIGAYLGQVEKAVAEQTGGE